MTDTDRSAYAALATLIVLQGIMLSALYAGVPPHPPMATPLFGIAPFLGASLSITVAAMILRPLETRTGRGLTLAAVLLALVSFGPQKYFDAQFALIWPAVVLGQLAALVLIAGVLQAAREQKAEQMASTAHSGQV